ncbi:tautomerase [Halobacteriales archaeon QS_3_64_16]|nr:MAG: tautomerase [Halobacteriales archaeon QS_3_64_16]
MPLLSFVTDTERSPSEKRSFAEQVAELYAEHMETTTGHIAVEIREVEPGGLWLGRADDPDAGHLFCDADIREGRSVDQRRAFALAVMDLAVEQWALPETNLKVVFTEHAGPEMMGMNRVGSDWASENTEG